HLRRQRCHDPAGSLTTASDLHFGRALTCHSRRQSHVDARTPGRIQYDHPRPAIRIGLMIIARCLIFALLLAQLSAPDRAAVERYRSAIKSAESGASARAIEAAFATIGPVNQALTQKLESLSDEEFKRLEQQLPGLLVNREEIVFIKPDVEYFTKLAAARG